MKTYTINGQPASRVEVMDHWCKYCYEHEIDNAGMIFAISAAGVDDKYTVEQCRNWMRDAGIEVVEG